MEYVPILDLTLLARLGFKLDDDGYHSRSVGGVVIRVDHRTGLGVLMPNTPVKFITVTHLKWFMDAFK